LEDFQLVYSQLAAGEEVTLPPKTTSYRQWARKLVDHAQTENVRKQSEYWLSKATDDIARLPLDFETGENTEASAQTVVTTLDEEETEALLSKVPAVYHTQINDVLLTALARVISQWIDSSSVWLTLESHGREPLFDDVDLSRTVGWFTVLYPVRLDLQGTSDLGEALMAVKEQLRQVPDHGIGYGLLRYLSQDQELAGQLGSVPESEICFNYLGQFDAVFQDETQGFTPAEEATGPDRSLAGDRGCILDINGGITGGRLQMVWSYSENLHRRETIERLAEAYTTTLRDIIAHCRSPEAGGYTPSDFPMANLDQRKLDKVLSKLDASQNSG
jgi:non-ribosomal peptide synthase protein (TIGR01720 family)